MMTEKKFSKQLALRRKESGITQEEFAEKLHISPQAVSKWENGHSLPETALLPHIARFLDVSIDTLFNEANLLILEALFGDGIETSNVTKRLNRLIENDTLNITVTASVLGVNASEERASYLTLKYKTSKGICFTASLEGDPVCLKGGDTSTLLPDHELAITHARYGSKTHHYNVMQKLEHYKPFHWNAYHANHELFPSDPANDRTEYLTLIYLSNEGIHMATCAEGESIAYSEDRTKFMRKYKGKECFIRGVPVLPPFGEGMECSWAAALTSALQAMDTKTSYEEVMGVSGACYRLAFCSPGWDYSSADGLVAYDYATPGFAAFGYTPEQYGHIEKSDRPKHRQKIMKQMRADMPVLGINLRVAPEWGVICGYGKEGEDLYCRTKYDTEVIESGAFMKGSLNPYDYLYCDNWPFLLCYFSQKRTPPTPKENFISSLQIFVDCAEKVQEGGYYMGIKAYEVWASDLRDGAFYESCTDEQIVRRFSVDQFCILSLLDARKSAYSYLNQSTRLFKNELLSKITVCFEKISNAANKIHKMLDSGMELDAVQSRQFWTLDKRCKQADALDEMAMLEREALAYAIDFLKNSSRFN